MRIAYLKVIAVFVLIILFPLAKSNAQTQRDDVRIRNINSFYKFIDSELNSDSALFYLKKIASHKLSSSRLPNIIHEELAQQVVNRSFAPDTDTSRVNAARRSRDSNKRLVAAIMADTNKAIKHIVNPLYLFSEIQDNPDDNSKLADLTDRFVREELSDADIYSNRAGRYALMIYSKINSKRELKPLAEKLLEKVSKHLEKGQVPASEMSNDEELGMRAWHRYLYAYVNIIKSEQVSDVAKQKTYLKIAYDYSPDVIDRQHQWAYFYDMYLIFNKEKASFRDEYLQYLTINATDQNSIVSTLLEIALLQPEYKEQLKTAYMKVHGSQADFPKFWMTSVNNLAKTAHPISLSMLDKSRFSNETVAGKWLLIDFWGTWCGPCRSEHPGLQKFYDSSIKTNPDKITLLTIACRDTEEKVTSYLNEKKFSFPVAMSDNKIEHIYKVPGYPTKLLVTPEGKYILVPAGNDWMSFVKHYADL